MSDESHLGHRLSDAERRGVSDALAAHADTGRLGAAEVEDRQLAASRAATWADVVPLFADLPAPHPPGMPGGLSTGPAAPGGDVRPAGTDDAPAGVGEPTRTRLSENQRRVIMTLTTFTALGIFFIDGHWLWFLAIPAVAVLLKWNDPDDEPRGRDRQRDRQRDRYRDR